MDGTAITQPDAEDSPELQVTLADASPEYRLEVLRNVLNFYKPFLKRHTELFSTLGAVTNDGVREWDYGALKYNRSTPCMQLYEFDSRAAGTIELAGETYPQQEAGGVLLLTPTLRILVYRWTHTNVVQKGRLPDDPDCIAPNRATMRSQLTSPDGEELAKLLTAPIVRRTAAILAALGHRQEEASKKELDEVSLALEEAYAYLAGVR